MDALSELLASVRVRRTAWLRLEAAAPWGVGLAAGAGSILCIHHVTGGPAWVSIEGGDGRAVAAGDVVVVPHGRAHALRDREGTPVIALDALVATRRAIAAGEVIHVGGGGETCVTSALIELDDPFAVPIVSSLPPALLLSGPGDGPQALADSLRFVAREIAARPFGGDLVLAHLADVVFVHTMRAFIDTFTGQHAQACRSLELVAALRDPNVAAALALMSQQPAEPWTVGGLAERVGLSRSVFAARFATLVGEPPLGFLTRMRMQAAVALLREGATLALVSTRTGYGSEAAFSHAFRQWAGVAPGAYRKQR